MVAWGMRTRAGIAALLPKKNSLHCVYLALKRIVSLSPVCELSFVLSLASKLVSVTELRLFYTSVRKNEVDFTAEPHFGRT